MRWIVLGAIGGVVARWLVPVAFGVRADNAGTALTHGGLVVPTRFGATIESAAAGALLVWLGRPLLRG